MNDSTTTQFSRQGFIDAMKKLKNINIPPSIYSLSKLSYFPYRAMEDIRFWGQSSEEGYQKGYQTRKIIK